MQAVNQKQFDQLVPIILKQVKQLQYSQGWQSISDEKIKGYKKPSKTDSVIIKTQITINFQIQKVVDFIMEDDCMQKLNDMLIKNKVVFQKKGKYKIFHNEIKTPFPLDNRESVQLMTWVNEGNKFYVGAKSVNYPIEPNPKCVMSCLNIEGWIFQRIDKNTTKVISFADIDPRGNIPDFIKTKIGEKRIDQLKKLQQVLKKV